MYHDSSAITVIDSLTTKVCATLNCNYIPTDDLADVLYVLVKQYMPNAIINVELNGAIVTAYIVICMFSWVKYCDTLVKSLISYSIICKYKCDMRRKQKK